jgi:glycosyltransferase involved in cell wall biosynthesis
VPHVLVVLHDVTLTGASHAVLKPLPDLEKRGWTFSFWCARPSRLYDDLVALGASVEGAPRGQMRYSWGTLRHPPGVRARLASVPRSLRAFRRHLRDTQPAVVHVNTLHCLQEALVARRAGFPVLVHSHEIPPAGLKGRVARAVTWRGAHEVIAPSRASAAALARRGSVPGIVHEPTVVPKADGAGPRPAGAPVVVGSIGILSRRKGSDLFVDAAERVLSARPDVEFRLVGSIEDSPEAPWARELVARAVAAGIHYAERVDVEEELRGWDVLVMPSRLDPFPLVVLEAMAAGRAVVGTAVDGIVDQLDDDAGVLVAPEDPAALAQAIEALVDDPARRAELGARARERVERNFTVEHTAAGLDDAYRRTQRSAGR